jgi:hypothetical protein
MNCKTLNGLRFESHRTCKVCYFFFGNARMYATNDLMTSGVSFFPKAGIFPVPLAITSRAPRRIFPALRVTSNLWL